jgi:hypothetical protein
VNYGLVIVKLSALSSLKPGGHVSFFVVNALCRLLFMKYHPRTCRKHYFFSKVGVSSFIIVILLFCLQICIFKIICELDY